MGIYLGDGFLPLGVDMAADVPVDPEDLAVVKPDGPYIRVVETDVPGEYVTLTGAPVLGNMNPEPDVFWPEVWPPI